MKIIGIEHNYAYAGNGGAETTLMADSALLQGGNPYFIPVKDEQFALFPSLAIKISRLGKRIAPRFAHRYWQQTAIGFNFRNLTLLEKLREQGLPWTRAISYDGSVALGKFGEPDGEAKFRVFVDGEEMAFWDASQLRENIDEVVSLASQYDTLKTGDIILVGFPEEGVKISLNQRITANGDECALHPIAFNIK